MPSRDANQVTGAQALSSRENASIVFIYLHCGLFCYDPSHIGPSPCSHFSDAHPDPQGPVRTLTFASQVQSSATHPHSLCQSSRPQIKTRHISHLILINQFPDSRVAEVQIIIDIWLACVSTIPTSLPTSRTPQQASLLYTFQSCLIIPVSLQ